MSQSTNLDTPASVLAVGAHPDDIEFQCGATLAKWISRGSTVHYLVLTDGSKGTWDPQADTNDLIAIRQVEQRNAALTLGVNGEIVFLGQTDGELQSTLELRQQVALWIRRLTPSVVLGHDPWRRYRLHPDHRHAGWLTVDAVVAARDPHFYPDDEIPHHRPDALLLFEAEEPDHVEDVTGFAEMKIAALLDHRSQLRSTMFIDPNDDGTQLAAFRTRMLGKLTSHGRLARVAEGEAFHLIDRL